MSPNVTKGLKGVLVLPINRMSNTVSILEFTGQLHKHRKKEKSPDNKD